MYGSGRKRAVTVRVVGEPFALIGGSARTQKNLQILTELV
jgi:hypothetical protein